MAHDDEEFSPGERIGSFTRLRSDAFISDDPEDVEDRIRSRRRPMGLLLGVLMGVSVAGGIGWYVYGKLPKAQPTASEIPVIRASNEVVKVKPDDPGGMAVPNRDKLIYQQIGEANAPTEEERLLPPAENPVEPPVQERAAPPPQPVAVAAPPPPKAAEKEPEAAMTMPSAPPPMVTLSARQQHQPDHPPQVTAPTLAVAAPPPAAVVPAAPPPAAAPAAPVAVAVPVVKAVPAPVAPAAKVAAVPTPAATPAKAASVPPAAAAKTAAPAGADGGIKVQLGALRSADLAEKAWLTLATRHKDVLGPLKHSVVQVDLGEKGVWYRVYAGPFSDGQAAATTCETLKQRAVGCIIAKK